VPKKTTISIHIFSGYPSIISTFLPSNSPLRLPILLWVILFLSGCQDQPENLPEIRYGSSPIHAEIPVHNALENDLFKAEGITVDMQLFPDGNSAMESLLNGDSDIVSTMTTPVALNAFQRKGFKVIAAIDHGKFHASIAKRKVLDHHPRTDWSNHTIGVTRHTSGEYFMYSYLSLHEVSWNNMNVAYGKGPELKRFFLNDSIDIMFSWNPYVEETREQYPDSLVELGKNHLVPASWMIVCDSVFLAEHRPAVRTFLRATKKGLEKAKTSKETAIRNHQSILHQGGYHAGTIHPEMIERMDISLDEELVLDLENQAQWLMDMNYVSDTRVPDFSRLICPDPLRSIDSLQVYLPIFYSCR
jgi:ABC-type nitrate/sulfonate/bicarbonate transport system substrate-binding protein